MKQSKLSAERARELFNYDPETGSLTWRVNKGSRAREGKPAGSKRDDGYLSVRADGEQVLVHRVIWLMHSGEWPGSIIDHKNGIRSDNRWRNLRDTSRRVNQENHRNSRQGSKVPFLGVSCKRGKFRSRIKVGGIERSLGSFSTPEEAHEVYLTAKRQLHAGCTI